VCTSSATELFAIFPTVPSTTMPTGTVTSPMGLLLASGGTWSTTSDGQLSSVNQVSSQGSTHANCAGNNAGTTGAVYRFQGNHLPIGARGDMIAPFDIVQYSVGDAAVAGSADPLWVRRGNTTTGSNQPLAGPVPSATSLEFRYYTTAVGGAPIALPATSPAGLQRITVLLTTRNRYRNDIKLTLTDSVTVYLRNQ
jgi:hypothetical protein